MGSLNIKQLIATVISPMMGLQEHLNRGKSTILEDREMQKGYITKSNICISGS